eukprot:TRINITY_DN66092_c0_g1_i1.p1 TRINITY_DN66092_c0_g1~~TRINITY_DN66092_c0_g1_i1.p1  ORF type:complete len:193 (-),score=36.89 TRINITY_DN66092_c0_g1_i1:126-704(-)
MGKRQVQPSWNSQKLWVRGGLPGGCLDVQDPSSDDFKTGTTSQRSQFVRVAVDPKEPRAGCYAGSSALLMKGQEDFTLFRWAGAEKKAPSDVPSSAAPGTALRAAAAQVVTPRGTPGGSRTCWTMPSAAQRQRTPSELSCVSVQQSTASRAAPSEDVLHTATSLDARLQTPSNSSLSLPPHRAVRWVASLPT